MLASQSLTPALYRRGATSLVEFLRGRGILRSSRGGIVGRYQSFSTGQGVPKIVPESVTLKRSRKLLGSPVLQRQLRAILHADLSSSSNGEGNFKQLYSPHSSVRLKSRQADENFMMRRRAEIAWVDAVVERLLAFDGAGNAARTVVSSANMHLGHICGAATWETTHLVENVNFRSMRYVHGVKASMNPWRLPLDGTRRRATAVAFGNTSSDERNNIRLISKAFRGRAINVREVLHRLASLAVSADQFDVQECRNLLLKSGKKGTRIVSHQMN